MEDHGVVSKRRFSKAGHQSGGVAFSRGALYELLANPIYVGEIRHRKDCHPGQHEAVLDRKLWDQVQQQLSQKAAHPRGQATSAMANLLAGKLFDEAGQPLYVSGTTKARRRYRYYVSRTKGTGGRTEEGWRLAAPGIERAVIAATAQILKDDSAIGTMLHDEASFSAENLASALQSIHAYRMRLETEGEHGADTSALIERVDLGLNELQLTLNLAPLVNPQVSNDKRGALKMKRSVPMQLRRRGVELRIVMAGETAAKPRFEPTLIKAIGRGRRWFAELACNRAQDTAAIAQREGVHDSYARRLLPLAFLAPSVVEAICAGRQPLDLTAESLTRRIKLPLAWAEQEKVLGLGATAF